MAVLSKPFILIMTLVLAACGGKLEEQPSTSHIFYSNKPATPFVMPEKSPKRIFAEPGVSFYVDEHGRPTTWGLQTCMSENLVDVVSIAGNAAVKRDGTVEAWSCSETAPHFPNNLHNVNALAVDQDYTLVLKNDGSVEAWGWGEGVSKMPPNLRNVVAISAGKDHGLVLHSDGRVTGWDGPLACCFSRDEFAKVDHLRGIVAIASGDHHNLALRNDGTVVSWGSYSAGIPPGLTNEFGAIAIAAEGDRSYALLANGDLVRWEINMSGMKVDKIGTLPGVEHIAVASTHGLAQKKDGRLMAWGNELASLLPSDLAGGVISIAADFSLLLKTDGEILSMSDRPVILGSDAPVVKVDARTRTNAALHSDGTLSVWAFRFPGMPFGDMTKTFSNVKDFVVTGSNQQVVILKTDGTVFLSSANLNAQEAEFVASLRNIVSVQHSGGYSVALNDKGELTAWRVHNSHGLQTYSGPSMIRAVGGSYDNIFILRSNGTVATWNPESSDVIEVAPELDDIVTIAGGYPIYLALKQDGTVKSINASFPNDIDGFFAINAVPHGLNAVAIYSELPLSGISSSQAALTRAGQLIFWGKSYLSQDFYQLPE